MQGLVGHDKEFAFYSKCGGKSLAIFKSGYAKIHFIQEKFIMIVVKDNKKNFSQEGASARGIFAVGEKDGVQPPI